VAPVTGITGMVAAGAVVDAEHDGVGFGEA
jgi:hypothetical protein